MKTRTQETTKTTVSYEWLMARGRDGGRRIEKLGWTSLAAIWIANKPVSAIRRAITNEARRCGYTPTIILALHVK